MVCIGCLLPLFLVPIVNLLPLIYYFIKAKVYAACGWEYVKPERAPPACPYKPAARNDSSVKVGEEAEPGPTHTAQKPLDVGKQD